MVILWTDCQVITNPILKRTLEVLQNLARKARQTTPYHLMAEAIEELNVRPILRARYRQSAERALANVEMVLEMARAYETRGLVAFADALRANWDDTQKHIEGRPDADKAALELEVAFLRAAGQRNGEIIVIILCARPGQHIPRLRVTLCGDYKARQTCKHCRGIRERV
jgi:hypothetical protein